MIVLSFRLSFVSEKHFQHQLFLLSLPSCLLIAPQQPSLLELPLFISHGPESQFLEASLLQHAPNQHFHHAQSHLLDCFVLEDEGLVLLEEIKKLLLLASLVLNRSQDTLLGLLELVQHPAG